ncbi:Hypothetical predicted protein [Mytilus galloprovincialis]|uniref:Uncharacterized protein n=1 Tax=Mytilus galloprovincialis TaxID=29158 RepID=A0A8B6C1K9_MYTGA|nr:Hypothetical predicted protein [Mytilus galloprovincialis]
MFPWIHHSGKKTVKASLTSKLQKKEKKKRGKNAPRQSTDEEPTSCCGKQVQRVVRLVKMITKKTKSMKRKQVTKKKGITALEKFNVLRNKQTMYDNIKTYKSEARKQRSPSDTSAYHTRNNAPAELIIDIHNLEDNDGLISMVPADDKNSTYYAHIQTTLELLKDNENLEHHTDLSAALPANEIIIANAQLQYTSNHISDKSYFQQLLSVSENKEFKEYVSDMESESESDINDREDYYINQQNRSKLIQREATAFVVCNDFIETKQVLSDLKEHYGGLERDQYVNRTSTQLANGNASAFSALNESESESETPVLEVQYSSNGICVKNGIPFMQSKYVFKRNTKAKQEHEEVKLFLFGNDDNQFYTRSDALNKFQNYEISTKDFKIVRFLRRDFHDVIEVFETQEPYQGKMDNLIQNMAQFEPETSHQRHFNVPLQPSDVDSKLGSSLSLPVNKWRDKVKSLAAKRNERADFTSFTEDRTKSVRNTSIDKTNIAMRKEPTRISQIPPKTESSEKKLSTKELALDSNIRKSISKSRNVSSTHRTYDPMLTSRKKMVDAKVKKTSKYEAPKLNIFTTLDDDETGISTVLRDDTVRQAIHGWFNNETKIQFQRPSIPWPSMHPLLPYKLRYLDESLVDAPVVKTSSSPNESLDETE